LAYVVLLNESGSKSSTYTRDGNPIVRWITAARGAVCAAPSCRLILEYNLLCLLISLIFVLACQWLVHSSFSILDSNDMITTKFLYGKLQDYFKLANRIESGGQSRHVKQSTTLMFPFLIKSRTFRSPFYVLSKFQLHIQHIHVFTKKLTVYTYLFRILLLFFMDP
jgi:hypothetical protein